MRPYALSPMFTYHMVLQRDADVPIWGTGPAGGDVTVTFRDRSVGAEVDCEGEWQVNLSKLAAGGPDSLVVGFGSDEEIVLRDVLVGDVWLAAGQSNMVQPLLVTAGGVEAAAAANLPQVRLFTVPRRPYPGARVPGWDFIGTHSDDAMWQLCTPETALLFTAIGFHFAERLHQDEQVPVGIVSCNWGGTPAQAWMSEAALGSDPELSYLLEDYRSTIAKMNLPEYEREHDRYNAEMEEMIFERGDIERRVRSLGLEGYRAWLMWHPLRWPDQPFGPKHPERPSGLFRSMLSEAAPYAIRGVLWYQGESNAKLPKEACLYEKLLTSLIADWRAAWERPDLPFLIVQLAGFLPPEHPYRDNWSHVREAQAQVADAVPNTAVVVALDASERADIHPVDKRTVADRLYAAARRLVYLDASSHRHEGPRFRQATFRGAEARIAFDPEGEPPAIPTDAVSLAGFLVCGEDRRFFPADARWEEDGTIVLSAPEVAVATAARYAWGNFPSWSVLGRNGVPASPFRTDDYDLQWD